METRTKINAPKKQKVEVWRKRKLSFYEELFGQVSTKTIFVLTTVVYVILLLAEHLGAEPLFGEAFPEAFQKALPALLTLVYWPGIIVCNSRAFHKVYANIRMLFFRKRIADQWYIETATNAFCLLGDRTKTEEPKSRKREVLLLAVQLMVLAHVFHTGLYAMTGKIFQGEGIKPVLVLLAPVGLSFLILCLMKKYKNLHTINFVMICGLTYYLYLLKFSNSSIQSAVVNFLENDLGKSIFLTGGVALVFFIAGTTIYPMIHMFVKFFASNLEEKLECPNPKVSETVNRLKSIKDFFTHLMGVNLIAYFQLLAVVYLAGIFNKTSVVALVLFAVGSVFPAAMYLAANVLFKRLMLKIYTKQADGIDDKIRELLKKDCNSKDCVSESIQALVATKEMYLEEFEVHIAMNKEVFAATLSPILTVILTILLPGSAG